MVENLRNKSSKVLLFKSHKWNSDLENFSSKLKKEADKSGVDFYILMHSDDGLLQNQIKDIDLRSNVLMFSQDDIRNVYEKGFFGMWLSNHWILMWFFKQYPYYEYYWTIEYDVRITGDSSVLWSYEGNEDYLYPIRTFQDPNWSWKNHYSGHIFNDNNKWYGYLQLARYSQRFLRYLNAYFESGENGQDEMIIFSLFKKGQNEIGLIGNHTFLNQFITDSWSVDSNDSDKHRDMISKSNFNKLTIYHPVK